MAETIAPTQPDVKTTANNIVQGVQDKAAGKSPNGGDSKAASAQPEVADPNAGKEKYVVNGQDVWLTPSERTAWIQKGIAFEPRVTQLSKLQNETNAFMEMLKTDPEKILFNPKIGHTPQAILDRIFKSGQIDDATKEMVGKWYYDNVVQVAKMDPMERKAMEAEKKLSEYEKKEQLARDNAIKMENQRRADMAGQQLLGFVREAMKESGLPDIDSPLGSMTAKRVLEVSRAASKAGKPITPKEAIEHVRREYKTMHTMFLDHLDEDKIVEEIGAANAEKVKKYFLKLVKEAEKQKPEHKPATTQKHVNGERKGVISPDDFRDYLDELKKKG